MEYGDDFEDGSDVNYWDIMGPKALSDATVGGIYRDRLGREADQNERDSVYENNQSWVDLGTEVTARANNATDPPPPTGPPPTGPPPTGPPPTGPSGPSGPSGPQGTPSQAWNNQGQNLMPDWSAGMMSAQMAQQEAARQQALQRSNAFYGQLQQRAQQGLNIDASDPIISGQVDAYRNEGTRSRNDYLDTIAERGGALANIQGERRMTQERLGQGVGGFQAQLLSRELQSRRDEIAQALQMQGSMLSGDQQRNLQMQLGMMDQAIGEAGISLGARGQDLQGALGFGGLDLQRQGLYQNNDQFMRELALREWNDRNKWNYNWGTI
mgnify:CR=1 FL=1